MISLFNEMSVVLECQPNLRVETEQGRWDDKTGRPGQAGRLDRSKDVPTFTANIFPATTNRTNTNQAPLSSLFNEMSMVLECQPNLRVETQ